MRGTDTDYRGTSAAGKDGSAVDGVSLELEEVLATCQMASTSMRRKSTGAGELGQVLAVLSGAFEEEHLCLVGKDGTG